MAKNKTSRTLILLNSQMTAQAECHIRCDENHPTCLYLCGNQAAVCQTVSVFFTPSQSVSLCRCLLPTETHKPKQHCTYRLMDRITSQIAKNSVSIMHRHRYLYSRNTAEDTWTVNFKTVVLIFTCVCLMFGCYTQQHWRLMEPFDAALWTSWSSKVLLVEKL